MTYHIEGDPPQIVKDDIPIECEGCGWDGPLTGHERGPGGYDTRRRLVYLCEVCYRSPLGIFAESGRSTEFHEVLRMMTLATNLILAELRKEKR